MKWIKKYGDLFFIIMALMYGLSRETGKDFNGADLMVVIALALIVINRVTKGLFKDE